jgi:hypothetical protein
MTKPKARIDERRERSQASSSMRDGISMTTVNRRIAQYRRAALLVGAFSSADLASNISANHDDYLNEAYD